MKKIGFIILSMIALVGFVTAQQSKNAPKAVFNKSVHDFEKVNESDKEATAIFTFKNEGNAPLIIQRAQAGCGCTKPDYTKEPILPGKEGFVSVAYSTTGRPGVFDRNVTVFTNVPDSIYILKIKGEVLRK